MSPRKGYHRNSNAIIPPSGLTNFHQCATRFNGVVKRRNEIENFLSSVEAFKEWALISDKSAIDDLAILLTGNALTWWKRVRRSITTWDEAIRCLRRIYGTKGHRVLKEIWVKEQEDECVDLFFSRMLSNFSSLLYYVPEDVKVYIVHSLLNPSIRDRIPYNIVSPDIYCLLARAKEVEEMLSEFPLPGGEIDNSISTKISNFENVGHQSDATSGFRSNMSSNLTSEPVSTDTLQVCKSESKSHDIESPKVSLSCSCGREGALQSDCVCKGTSSDNNAENPKPRRFEVLSVNLLGPLPKTSTGKRSIMIVKDVCSHWVELFAVNNVTSGECVEVLISEVFLRFGIPRKMIIDQEDPLVVKMMQHACLMLGIELSSSDSDDNGAKNDNLMSHLLLLLGKDLRAWDTNLPAIRYALNSVSSAAIEVSPAFITFKRRVAGVSDVAARINSMIEKNKKHNLGSDISPFFRNLSATLLAAEDVFVNLDKEENMDNTKL